MQQPTVQMRSLIRGIIAEGGVKRGEIFWTTEFNARRYIELKVAEPIVGPAEQPAPGPSETKPQEPLEKKSSSADPAGPSTDSAPSSAPGTAPPSSASQAAPVSRKGKSRAPKGPDADPDLLGPSE